MNGTMILASASPRRREILSQAGIRHEVMVSDFNERDLSPETAGSPENYVRQLAAGKARAVFDKCTKDESLQEKLCHCGKTVLTVLGADTVVAHRGKLLNKPADAEDAVRMLLSLQGDVHEVYTGVALCFQYPDRKIEYCDFAVCTKVGFYAMTEAEIREYLECGEYADKAGAYAIQGRFAPNIKEIHGDYLNVVGLPVSAVVQECKKRGIRFF